MTMHESSLILKQDAMGRVRSTPERRTVGVADFRRSGLSGHRFARQAGMKYPTLMAWMKRHSGSTPAVRKATVKQRPLLMEAVVGGPAGTVPPVLMYMGGGVRLELVEAVS